MVTPERRVIISFEDEERKAVLRSVRALGTHADGFLLRLPTLLRGSFDIINDVSSLVRKLGWKKPVIADTRWDTVSEIEELHETSALVKRFGGYALTVFSVDRPPTFLSTCSKSSSLLIMPVIDFGISNVEDGFPGSAVIELARTSVRLHLPEVIMSVRHADRIRKLREAKVSGLRVLAYLEPGAQRGAGIEAGADFEIVPSSLIEK